MLTYVSGLRCKKEIGEIQLHLSSVFIPRNCLVIISDFVLPKSYLNAAYYLMKLCHNLTAEENKSTFAIVLYNLYILRFNVLCNVPCVQSVYHSIRKSWIDIHALTNVRIIQNKPALFHWRQILLYIFLFIFVSCYECTPICVCVCNLRKCIPKSSMPL